MQPIRVLVLTSDKYNWCLQPFAYLFHHYWSDLQPVLVAGFTPPPFTRPSNFDFYQIDKENYPANRWSNGLIKVLKAIPDKRIILLLEDYWMCRTVDARGVMACADYMASHEGILRFDLTADRLYAGEMYEVESYGCYDVIATPNASPYQMSLQAAIWDKELLLQVLKPDKSAWEVEIHTSPPQEMKVLGLRQWPVRYANAVLKGRVDWNEVARVPKEHIDKVYAMIPAELRKEREEKVKP